VKSRQLAANLRVSLMRSRYFEPLTRCLLLAGTFPLALLAQIPMSDGPYQQNFNSLATSGTANSWENNVTLPGWYSTRNGTNTATYRAGDGGSNIGDLWSYGVAGVNGLTDRALGSVASGSASPIHFGLRFTNNSATTFTNFFITVTGEQWRNGNNAATQTLDFSYQVSAGILTNPALATGWINFPALNFATPNPSATGPFPLDGNASTNRQEFVNVFLNGVSVAPGQEMFLRWTDLNDSGNDHGFGIDDLIVTFDAGVALPPAAPEIVSQPQSQVVAVGTTAEFFVSATGNPPPSYQWQFHNTNLPGATASTLTFPNVTTNQSGPYRVIVSNSVGTATSSVAHLIVYIPTTLSVLTYNVKGNDVNDWSTNSLQVQAIARQLQYLQPDVITFNEIPWDFRYEMTNFVAAFLPGYQIAISTGTDSFICSAIASRHPITRATKWLDGVDLRSFGYSNANNTLDNFTRDLYEAEIAVPGFARPLHVFTTHLKATTSGEFAESAAKRAAEAAAITNFFATNLFAHYPYDPYVLTGDMNANDTNELCIQKLISPATGLVLTDPKNLVTGSINTFSTATANPGSRLDYIFPGPLLFSNLRTGLVFRSSLVNPLPPSLNSNDSQVGSDHYPVLLVFDNPYDKPFQLHSITRSNVTVMLEWNSVFGQTYRVETSTNLSVWTTEANNLVATGTNFTYSTNLNDAWRFFRIRRTP
jgi:endonuclease/exonuclease/phosphatase family metal-dependent hydrolase